MPADLTATAAANDAARESAADVLVAADPSGTLGALRTRAGSAAMSTNVDAEKLRRFIVVDQVLTGLQLAILAADADPDAGRDEFSARSWSARRQAFEGLWVHGERAIYGAVNIGGLGTQGQYGRFCLVIDDPTQASEGLAIFPSDSAQRYTDAAAVADERSACADATSWERRGCLVTIERHVDALTTSPTSWDRLICEAGRYLEVVRIGGLPLEHVHVVRIPKLTRRALQRAHRRRALGKPLTARQNRLAATWAAMLEWRRRLPIRIETI